MKKKALVQKLKKIILKYPEVETAYLHGSFAKGNETVSSDIDIAIYGDKIDFNVMMALKGVLEDKLNRDVDIALLTRTTDPIFAKQIMQYGDVIIQKNKHKRILMETDFTLKYFDQAHFRKQMSEIRNNHLGL